MDVVQSLPSATITEALVFTLCTSLIVGLAGTFLSQILSRAPLSHVPEIGGDIGDAEKRRMFFLMHGKKLYEEGYHKVQRASARLFRSYSDSIQYKNGLFRLIGSDSESIQHLFV